MNLNDVLGWLTTILIFFGTLFLLVIVHEVGHFLTARRFRVRVHEFGIGFPPRARVLGSDGETLYTLNWLPIGGFVRLEGEDGGDAADPRSFASQPLWKRVVVLTSGVVMNLVLAVGILASIAAVSDPTLALRIGEVAPGSPAATAGLQPDESIEAVNGEYVLFFDGGVAAQASAASAHIRDRAGQQVTLTLLRPDGSRRDVLVRLRAPAETPAGQGPLGVRFDRIQAGSMLSHDPLTALEKGLDRTWQALGAVVGALGGVVRSLVTRPTAPPPDVGGPVAIAATIDYLLREFPAVFVLWLAGVLSANIAIINIMPLPPLDGGRIAVAVIQKAVGGRISVSAERLTYFIGFVLLMAFVVWITVSDMLRVAGASP